MSDLVLAGMFGCVIGSGLEINVKTPALRALADLLDNQGDNIGRNTQAFLVEGGDLSHGFTSDWYGGASHLYAGYAKRVDSVLNDLAASQRTLRIVASKLRTTADVYDNSDQQGVDLAKREWDFIDTSGVTSYVLPPFTETGNPLAPAGDDKVFTQAATAWRKLADDLQDRLGTIWGAAYNINASGDWADDGYNAFWRYFNPLVRVDFIDLIDLSRGTAGELDEIAGRMQSMNRGIYEAAAAALLFTGINVPSVTATILFSDTRHYADYCRDMGDRFADCPGFYREAYCEV